MLKDRKCSLLGGVFLLMLAICLQAYIPGDAQAATGSFEFGAANYTVNEGAGKIDIVVKRVEGATGSATVQIRTNSQTTDYRTDYESFSWTTLNFADGETRKIKSIIIKDDTVLEGNEAFTVSLGNPTGGTRLGSVNRTLVTVADNDGNTVTAAPDLPGSFEFSASAYNVNESTGKIDVVIKRVGGAKGAATVDMRTNGQTATFSADYASFSWTTLKFADGETQKVKSIAIVDDATAEGNETFTASLRNPTGGASLGATKTTTVTIVDNDKSSSSTGTDTTPDSGSTPPVVNPNLGYLPVFPGAMGHGTETKAGRGGKIIKVTNLNDSGAGSLRAAIDATGPRIVVFEVSGTIRLSSAIRIRNPYITIAGQSAPSPGITLRNNSLAIYTHDVLVQHLRTRVGDECGGPVDGLQVLGPNAYNVVIDHISSSWAIDENMSTWYALKNVTFSNCLISEALFRSIHPEGPHSMGLLLGNHAKNVTVIGNLFAHNNWRLPRINGDVSAVVANNLMYNGGNVGSWMSIGSDAGPNIVSAVGNKFISGPNSRSSFTAITTGSTVTASGGSKIYCKDNQAPSTVHSSTSALVSSAPIWHKSLVIYSSSEVEKRVLASAGARPVDRDSVDKRVVSEVLNRSGRLRDSQYDVGGWPSLAANYRTFSIPASPNGDSDGDGYTNVEEVLHQMAASVE